MIEQLIAILRQEIDLTPEEVADILWLACIRSEQTSHTPQIETISQAEVKPTPALPVVEDDPLSLSPVSPVTKSIPILQTVVEYPVASIEMRHFLLRVPTPPLIRRSLVLAKALQPLRQSVFSKTTGMFDEVATAQNIAEKQAWMPVLQPVSEPALEVALVVDESISEIIWRSTILEVKKLLENYSLFRNIQTWGLRKNQYGLMKVRPGFGFSSRSQIFQDPKILADPTGQRLILIVTDCVSSVWNDGSILPALRVWTQNNPLAILQLLPEYMWFRTKLEQALAVEFRSPEPALANQNLFVRSDELWDESDPLGVKVPVFTLEPKMALMWSRMLASFTTSWAPGYIFQQNNQLLWQDELYSSSQQRLSAEERVQRFRISASVTAERLAVLLAGVPMISFPIIRLIQNVCIPESSQVHVVEVLLGGLFEPLPSEEIKINPDELLFNFVAGVRELLLGKIAVQDSLSVLKVFLRLIADQRGTSFEEFLSLVMNPQQIGDRDFVELLHFIRAHLFKITAHFNMNIESLINTLIYDSENR